MNTFLRHLFRRARRIVSRFWGQWLHVPGDAPVRPSFSQNGEDVVLARIFGDKPKGFYIDVGAHHPIRFSNTYAFYRQGWHGINIDAKPGSMRVFNRLRPRDINLEQAIGEKRERLTYYCFDEAALNSFSREQAMEWQRTMNNKIIEQISLETLPLHELLATHLQAGTAIDFLTIDAEGLDYEIMVSNDWEKFRPHAVIIEDVHTKFPEGYAESKVYTFLRGLGYELDSKTGVSLIFTSTR